jgi:uncharacterized protein (TIGR02594 family)
MTTRFISAKYDVATLTVDYAGSDGTHLLRTGGTIAWRFNNPGNIRPATEGILIMGAIGIGTTKGNGSFLIFASYEDGRAQKKSLLRRKYNQRTIYTMLAGIPDENGKPVQGYAPASDKNDPVAYADSISKHTGLPTTTKLSDLSDAQLDQVLDAMEIKEGFNNQKDTRKERWLATTEITVSDGALPQPNLSVRVTIGDKVLEKKTDARGQLPPIAHVKSGESVRIELPTLDGLWKNELEFITGTVSNAYVLFRDLSSFTAPTAPKKPPAKADVTGRQPLRYIVQKDDTLGKLAMKFKTTAIDIKRHNRAIKANNIIYVGQELGIYGPPPRLKTTPPIPHPGPPAAPIAGTPASTGSGKPKPPAQPAAPTRSNEGKGAPLAIVPSDQKQAPWMLKAIEEGKKWAGKYEDVITKTENFHKEIGQTGNLSSTPWCASFVNFCLKSSGVPYEPSASSQFPISSKKFIKIDKPVYGCLMVMRNYVVETGKFAGSGHVTFVYGRNENGRIACLGGNQKDSIKVSDYATTGDSAKFKINKILMAQRFYAFYIPASYAEYAKKTVELAVVDSVDINKGLLNIANAGVTKNESSR